MRKMRLAAIAFALVSLACLPAFAEKTKVTFMGWGAEGRYHELFEATFKAYPELAQKYEIEYSMAPGSGVFPARDSFLFLPQLARIA